MEEQLLLAQLRGVRFRYPGQVVDLFQDVTLKIRPGEVVMLAGPNGSGKSTVLGLLSGRLFPSAGSVRVFGQSPHKATRAPELGLITEPFHPEESPLPVDFTLQQILTWLEILDMTDSRMVSRLLDELGLARSLLNHPIRTLSKGERQRVMLLVVLARKPRLLLADEPLEGLDRQTRRLIGQRLHEYAKEDRRGVFWVSHHLSETLQYADRLLEIEDRRLIERQPDRFECRLLTPSGDKTNVHISSLAALPGVVSEHLGREGSVRVEIADTAYSEDKP